MKARSIFARTALAVALVGGSFIAAETASAQERPQRVPYGEAHLMPVDVNVSIGMHGDRYWDGHRYWEHDEWAHRHPHDRDPWHRDDDRRPHPREDEPHRY
ncbi:hypothetical protein B0G57_109165 [Trinickia symbiotica]|uniref:DUF2502 domain-containing protein n=1 Tax=Trinickia symbiotica TaxID=863227 RepID=A0A2N7X7P1_9BURK|nr:hypothetical protein [Trinickia symbiotica]PMS37779.1 hypothetical protein C0Z20_07480 [Trinickia symbiotica]PPK44329.1 hypothetical protein B0G57_109165 [Trinickia symbiotica]